MFCFVSLALAKNAIPEIGCRGPKLYFHDSRELRRNAEPGIKYHIMLFKNAKHRSSNGAGEPNF